MAQHNSMITVYRQDENGRASLIELMLTDDQQALRDELRAELARYLTARTARAMLDLRASGLNAGDVMTVVSDVLSDLTENGWIMVTYDE